jgi:hypothetical protein
MVFLSVSLFFSQQQKVQQQQSCAARLTGEDRTVMLPIDDFVRHPISIVVVDKSESGSRIQVVCRLSAEVCRLTFVACLRRSL